MSTVELDLSPLLGDFDGHVITAPSTLFHRFVIRRGASVRLEHDGKHNDDQRKLERGGMACLRHLRDSLATRVRIPLPREKIHPRSDYASDDDEFPGITNVLSRFPADICKSRVSRSSS